MAEKLLYIHIPKTAGQAFGEFLSRHLGPDNCSPGINRIKFKEAISRYNRYRLISGHLYPEIGDEFPRDRVSIVTLRQPIDRFISDFSFVRSSMVDIQAIRKHQRYSLDQYIENLSSNDMQDLNLQTTMLWPLGSPQFSREWTYRVSCAKKALESIDFVGLQAELDDFAAMVAGRFGWDFRNGIAKVNVTRQRNEFDSLPRVLQIKLEDLLAPDIELYDYARNIFLRNRRNLLCHPWRWDTKDLQQKEDLILPELPENKTPPINLSVTDIEPIILICSTKIAGELSATPQLLTGEFVNITIEFELKSFVDNLTIGFGISEKDGSCVFSSNTNLQGYSYNAQAGRYYLVLRFLNRLGEGDYRFGVRFHQSDSHFHGLNESFGDLISFNVIGNSGEYFEGRFLLNVMPTLTPVSDKSQLDINYSSSNNLNTLVLGWVNSDLPEFRCTIIPLDKVINLKGSTPFTMPVEIFNTSGFSWPSEGKKAVFLSYHWISLDDGSFLIRDGIRTPIPRDIHPGEKVAVNAQCLTPKIVGPAQLVWDMVQEHVMWFGDIDSSNLVSLVIDISQ